MDHTALVRVRQAFEQLDHDVELALEGERIVRGDDGAQVVALDQLHGDVELIFGLAEVVQGNEVGCWSTPAARASRRKRWRASPVLPTRLPSSLRATYRRMTVSYAFH